MFGKMSDMFIRINAWLSGVRMTAAAGLFLVMSLALTYTGAAAPVDPAWAAVLICGLPLLSLAVRRLVCNQGISRISSALLITLAMFAAIAIGDLFAAGEVAFIMAAGALLEERITDRAKKGLIDLISLMPALGRRITDGREEMIPAEEIRPGDRLLVLPGETIPADGVIVSGETSVDQSIMTGESLPADKGIGDEVFCGTINRFGAIDILAARAGRDSSLQKLIRLTEAAAQKQAPMQRIADKAASWLVPAALLITLITGLLTKDIVRAVTVLVVFCPCALVLATPTAIMAAIGQASRHGVVIKSGEALEKMDRVNTIALDKTGTLTTGRLSVCGILAFDGSPDDLLSLAASAEARSGHPLGKAVVACAEEKSLPLIPVSSFSMAAGKGVFAEAAGKKLLCGHEKYLAENGVAIGAAARAELKRLQDQGKASILVAADGRFIGILALSDALRPEAEDTVARLTAMGMNVVLLTGDNKKAAGYFASRAGITAVCAELLPEEKAAHIERLQANGDSVCMVGDGINDAPALKTAAVGVAVGSMGSDIAVGAADIALMSSGISKIPYLKRLSGATVKTIRLSIALSLCINFFAVLLSVMGLLTPTTGALVHNAGSCFVVMIAALLYDRKFD